MDIRKVKKLIELLEESGVAEIEIREGEESVRISRGVSAAAPVMVPQTVPAPAPDPAALQAQAHGESAAEGMTANPQEGNVVESPMVGTFYTAPTPESPPFAAVGQTVSPGDTLCIIEAMKIMNPIEAEVAGTISAVLAENGRPVEYGQPLFIIA